MRSAPAALLLPIAILIFALAASSSIADAQESGQVGGERKAKKSTKRGRIDSRTGRPLKGKSGKKTDKGKGGPKKGKDANDDDEKKTPKKKKKRKSKRSNKEKRDSREGGKSKRSNKDERDSREGGRKRKKKRKKHGGKGGKKSKDAPSSPGDGGKPGPPEDECGASLTLDTESLCQFFAFLTEKKGVCVLQDALCPPALEAAERDNLDLCKEEHLDEYCQCLTTSEVNSTCHLGCTYYFREDNCCGFNCTGTDT